MPRLNSKLKRKSKKQSRTEVSDLSLKEQLAQKRKAKRERQQVILLLTMTVFLATVVGLAMALLSTPKIGVAAAAGISSLLLAYKYPRKALWAFLIYLPFAGTLTYVIGNSPLLQLAKDGLYIPALIGLFQEYQSKKLPFVIPKKLQPSLVILFGSCLLTLLIVNGSQQLAPECVQLLQVTKSTVCKGENDQPILMGILGFKIFLGYIPLIFCAYHLIRSKEELVFTSRLLTVLAIICCGLGFMQYLMLKTGTCAGTDQFSGAELFKASLEARCFVGGSLLYSPSQGLIRLPGTFVSPWHWGWFLIANAFFTYATAFSDPLPRWRTLGLVGMASVFIMSVISGQRVATVLVPITTGIMLILTGQVANLKRFLPIGVGLGLVLGGAVVTYPEVVQERWQSLVSRWEASPPQQMILDQFEFTLKNLNGSLFGLGLGRATNSARALGDVTLIETWFPKVMHEVGLLGLTAFLIVVTTLTVLTFKAYRSVRDKNLRIMGASFWVFVLFISYQTYWYPLDTDPVAVYYWFLAGVILKLPEIDQQELEKPKLTQENAPRSKSKRRKRASRKRIFA
ncbi:hormogonium polysaccharide biosynthesis protein HpsL [Lyngbya aestuarii]|uniref:hormogonium polysaccharide biosynthesis protein HpsL n=1 Tax=Lyngbya aestuarii TaxID=118322 RepID=UPI00403DD21D